MDTFVRRRITSSFGQQGMRQSLASGTPRQLVTYGNVSRVMWQAPVLHSRYSKVLVPSGLKTIPGLSAPFSCWAMPRSLLTAKSRHGDSGCHQSSISRTKLFPETISRHRSLKDASFTLAFLEYIQANIQARSLSSLCSPDQITVLSLEISDS